jgi:hypothetical protein
MFEKSDFIWQGINVKIDRTKKKSIRTIHGIPAIRGRASEVTVYYPFPLEFIYWWVIAV